MPDIVIPPDLADLQRRVNAAWVAVEEHRKRVDAVRRAEAVPVRDAPKWASPSLREWSAEESARHRELMGEVTAAADARLAGLEAAGLGTGYDVVQALHAAAREGHAPTTR